MPSLHSRPYLAYLTLRGRILLGLPSNNGRWRTCHSHADLTLRSRYLGSCSGGGTPAGSKPFNGKRSAGGLSSVMEGLGDLWAESQYDKEFVVFNFMKSASG